MTCNACRRNETTTEVPLIGPVCKRCLEIISRPQVLNGLVPGESLLFIARAMSVELDRRVAGLLAAVREACE